MAGAITDLVDRVSDSSTGRPVIASLASPGKALGATTINIDSATNWTTESAIHFAIYDTVTVAGVTIKDTSTQTDWKGTLAGTAIGNLTLTGGTDREYTAGAIVELTPTARMQKDLYDWAMAFANQDGSLKAAPIQTALNLGAGSLSGWDVLGATISSVTYNGNRSYDLTVSTDVTATLSPGMRLRTTRGTAAPTQSTSLNGTSQYWSKTAPAGMTFTDDFVVSAWVKLNNYPSATVTVASRFNGTSGWFLAVNTDGVVRLEGTNGSASNFSRVITYQSLPLNKWVHITAQLDMSAYTATSTTSYIMFDGVEVPASVLRGGTNPTALVQAGNLEVGSSNGGFFFPGKIAQVAVFSAKVTQATMRGYISQGLAGTETSLISAYSFNGVATDLNTTNANNLTASGAATATNADSPFGGQAGGTISSTLDYGIVQKVTATTLTVQVAEGCTIPTSGSIAAVSYSSVKSPYGFPGQTDKWVLYTPAYVILSSTTTPAANTAYNSTGYNISIPAGKWKVSLEGLLQMERAAGGTSDASVFLGTTNASTVGRIPESVGAVYHRSDAASTFLVMSRVYKQFSYSTDSATVLYLNTLASQPSSNLAIRGDWLSTGFIVQAENAYL